MTAKLTKQEFVNWLKQSEGKQYDMDGWYGFQCFDYANAGWQQLYGYNLSGAGAKDIPFVNNFTGKAKIIQNTPEFIAEPGDMVVFNNKYGGGYGHVAWVISADINNITVLEQNWLGGGWTNGPEQGGTGWEKVTKRTHSYDFPMWFIRPNFKQADLTVKSSQSATAGNKKSTVKQKAKPFKLQIVKDVVQGYKLPQRGYKPKYIVIHNDAGSKYATAESYRNGLVKAPLSGLEAGIAHSYVSGNTVWQALDESQVGWHTASKNGNRDGYGIEVCQSMGADNATFLKNEQATFQECARLLKKWELPANRNTIRLHNEFVSTSCPHRSALLHTGFDPVSRGAMPKDKQLELKDYFIKQIRAFMNGDIPVATVSNKSSASSNTVKPIASAWKRNSYGTYYMAEKARFINGNQPITVRLQGPFTTCPIGYQFQPGGYCDYDEVMLQDGHVWIGYDWQGQRYYLPIRTWNGAAPPNHSVGDLWGSIK
ncbi:SH3 domain-containing protein [Staphylococcus hyicus]|uniref:SH3 domain-containing protein n=1 Tax=Staphylococcus hyicus TaxID=1284 RepID=UPI00208F94DC|nr:SH3 domain-containing protein [Staphylococcus hyicus]MCO4330311.1 SH3 domain-containing protein [Staphylococcus hyicus]MCO4335863.1 SH3 domain-containing protein [Staphylococcus hyicus]